MWDADEKRMRTGYAGRWVECACMLLYLLEAALGELHERVCVQSCHSLIETFLEAQISKRRTDTCRPAQSSQAQPEQQRPKLHTGRERERAQPSLTGESDK